MATAKAKPDGIFELTKETFLTDSDALGVGKLPGVGWRMEKKLRAVNIQVLRDIGEKVCIPRSCLKEVDLIRQWR